MTNTELFVLLKHHDLCTHAIKMLRFPVTEYFPSCDRLVTFLLSCFKHYLVSFEIFLSKLALSVNQLDVCFKLFNLGESLFLIPFSFVLFLNLFKDLPLLVDCYGETVSFLDCTLGYLLCSQGSRLLLGASWDVDVRTVNYQLVTFALFLV